MKRLIVIALASTALGSPAWAQSATGVGIAKSDATSVAASRATAIGGGQGIGVGTGGNPTAAVTVNGTPAQTTSTINNTGTVTQKNVPSVFAPGLAAAGLETCLGSVSGGGAFVGTGFSFGTTIPDPGCAARLDARTLWAMGLKKAAIARLCLNGDIARSMPEVCATYLPQPQTAAVVIPPVPASYYYSEGTYQGGPIMLVEGKTGAERLCQNYDEPKHRCRLWDGETRVVMHHRAKPPAKVQVTAASPSSPTPAVASTEGKTE